MKGLTVNLKDIEFYGNEFLDKPILDIDSFEETIFYIQSCNEKDSFLNIEFIEQDKSIYNANLISLSIDLKLIENSKDYEAGSLIDGIVISSLIKNFENTNKMNLDIMTVSKNILKIKF